MPSGGERAATLPSPASLSADPLLSSVPLPWDSQDLPVLICSTTAVRFSTALSSRCSGQPLRPGPRVSPAPGPCPSPRRSRSFKGIVICAFPCRLVRFCQTPGTPPMGPGQAARRRPCPTGRCCSSQHLQPCHRHVCAKGNPTTPPALKFQPLGSCVDTGGTAQGARAAAPGSGSGGSRSCTPTHAGRERMCRAYKGPARPGSAPERGLPAAGRPSGPSRGVPPNPLAPFLPFHASSQPRRARQKQSDPPRLPGTRIPALPRECR